MAALGVFREVISGVFRSLCLVKVTYSLTDEDNIPYILQCHEGRGRREGIARGCHDVSVVMNDRCRCCLTSLPSLWMDVVRNAQFPCP